MLPKISCALVAITANLALAAPATPQSLPLGSFKVPVKGRQPLSGLEALAHAYRKFGKDTSFLNDPLGFLGVFDPLDTGSTSGSTPLVPSATPSATSSAAPETTTTGNNAEAGEVAANPEPDDEAYYSPVTIGGQALNLDFDTGSSDLWVFSTELPSKDRGSHTAFNPSQSSTWSYYEGGGWNISYGDGSSAEGNVGFDVVKVGGVSVNKQCVELAKEVSGSFVTNTYSDGLLGLGFSNINTVYPNKQKTFAENIMQSLSQPVFTADLDTQSAGTYEFGVIDPSKYTGEIHYTSIDPTLGTWMFNSTSYSVGGKTGACHDCVAIADTGTSLILMETDVVDAYYAQVPGSTYSDATGWIYPCGTTMPDLGIAIGDYMAIIDGADMEYENYQTGCFAVLQNGTSEYFQVFGDAFLKHYFAVFDMGNSRFGVAQKA